MRYKGKTVIYDLMTDLGLSDFYSLGGVLRILCKNVPYLHLCKQWRVIGIKIR